MREIGNAFVSWFRRECSGDTSKGANILLDMTMFGPSDSQVWNVLENTGHKEYTKETFRLAAEMLLGSQKEAS